METCNFSRAAAVLLAAGQSTRMGRNKLLLEIGGMALIRRVALAYLDAGIDDVVVVTGHQREAVEGALDGLAVRCAFNPAFANGQTRSIHAGLAAVGAEADVALVGLGDMPLLGAGDIRALASRWANAGKPVCVPCCDGVPGHPVAFAADRIGAILDGRIAVGRQRLLQENSALVDRWESGNPHYVRDIDSEDDLRALLGAGN